MASSRQSVHSIHNRQFWTDFFLLYESLPALWNMRCPLYKERRAKVEAYDILVNKLREMEPHADREDVLRKINIFRTNYRRECSRINMSVLMGKRYKTTLWYFDLLRFLQSPESRRDKKSNEGEKSILRKKPASNVKRKPREITSQHGKRQLVTGIPQILPEESFDYEHYEEDAQFEFITENECDGVVIEEIHCEAEVEEGDEFVDEHNDESSQNHFQNEFQSFSLQRILSPQNESQENETFLAEVEAYDVDGYNINDSASVHEIAEKNRESVEWALATENLTKSMPNPLILATHQSPKKMQKHVQTMTMQTPQSILKNSDKTSTGAEILAKSWAIQYDEMSDDQKIYARKAIADILFEGCMGNLGRFSGNLQQYHSEDGAAVEESSTFVCEDELDFKTQDWILK